MRELNMSTAVGKRIAKNIACADARRETWPPDNRRKSAQHLTFGTDASTLEKGTAARPARHDHLHAIDDPALPRDSGPSRRKLAQPIDRANFEAADSVNLARGVGDGIRAQRD